MHLSRGNLKEGELYSRGQKGRERLFSRFKRGDVREKKKDIADAEKVTKI